MSNDRLPLAYENVAARGATFTMDAAGGLRIVCPAEPRVALYVGYVTTVLAIATVLVGWAARSVASVLNFDVARSAALMAVIAFSVAAAGLLLLLAVPRAHDEIRVTATCVILEQWGHGLTKRVELAWAMAEQPRVIENAGREVFVFLGPEDNGFAIPWHAHAAGAREAVKVLAAEIDRRQTTQVVAATPSAPSPPYPGERVGVRG